ncbi:MAG TPA: 3-deoxy-7-phosphoheptulonate synthase [Candidatus Hydrogenedens sp.]|nr:3-deoxy-7-phosphoheptulonate synthase [Candidatus Hydrogenedens sp.]HOK09814.1 3-deoxy-7-phosphoheptulonate synthase [Candidatus Hydrogenedens sp.]HOL19471.1 3-deoxy-7-phosphoheptulonate synthase [Candidatus Hydrogenedens sp.]HPP59425.1 3-deoxy-7-phosphoheptulonate synthase [Candidatus Hydrogenedens sp.]
MEKQQLHAIENINIVAFTPLITPREIKKAYPMTDALSRSIAEFRNTVGAILRGEDNRFMIIVGPCSIHSREVALDYAQRLLNVQKQVSDVMFIIMRTYFEKPRTTLGWKGLIYDPDLDSTHNIAKGLNLAREILIKIAEMGLPTGTELLDPIVPQYISDLVCWASIGARTTESQTHREMASGFSMPIGFKNSTDGNLQVAIDAMISARGHHHFLGIDEDGRSCIIETAGNSLSHIILRGGRGRPNYDPVSVIEAVEQMQKVGLPPRIVIDCSHANCGKRYVLQAHVLRDVIQQRIEGNRFILGAMLESNIKAGNQPFPPPGAVPEYGVSITDPCLGWEETETVILESAERLRKNS